MQQATDQPADQRLIVMLVYPGVMTMDVFGPLEAFATANHAAGRPLYRLEIAGMTKAPVATSLRGVEITPTIALDDIAGPIDTLLVSGGFGQPEASADQRLLAWLRSNRLRARRCGSICTGAFVLDGSVYTSAGVTTGIDLALSLIEEDHGRTLSLRVARALVAYLKRPGGQSQFSNHLLAQFAASPPVRQAQEWALENLSSDLSVRTLAKRARMSERSFRRAFVEETGEAPRDFVERIRIDAARSLFEEAQLSVQVVATRCGFDSADNLRRAFVRRLGVTPHDYRQRFRLADNELPRAAE
jgi:transcriptional regulator GlxA family with amidase domain